MKKLTKLMLSLTIVLLAGIYCGAQNNQLITEKQMAANEAKIRALYGSEWQFFYDEKNILTKMWGSYQCPVTSPKKEDAVAIATEMIRNLEQAILLPASDFVLLSDKYNPKTKTFYISFQQYHNGVLVEGKRINFAMRDHGEIYQFANLTATGLNVDTGIDYDAIYAVGKVRQNFTYPFLAEEEPVATIVILPENFLFDNAPASLCHKIRYDERTFYVDANSGMVIGDIPNYRYSKNPDQTGGIWNVNPVEYSSNSRTEVQDVMYLSDSIQNKLDFCYSGTINGMVYPLTNPNALVLELKPLCNLPVNFYDQNHILKETTHTDENGNYELYSFVEFSSMEVVFNSWVEVRRSLRSNSHPPHLSHTYNYNQGEFIHNFTFQDQNHVGGATPFTYRHEPTVYFNAFNHLYYLNEKFADMPDINTIVEVIMTDYGGADGATRTAEYNEGGARASHTIRHEVTHIFVYQENGNQWLTPNNRNRECIDEAYAWYYPCAGMEDPVMMYPDGISQNISTLIAVQDLVDPKGGANTLNEIDHGHYHNQKAVASAWWALRNTFTEDGMNQRLHQCIEDLRKGNVSPRDHYNQLLLLDDNNDDPLDLTPHFNQINLAYFLRGMNYYPYTATCDLNGLRRNVFSWTEDIYAYALCCPTNENVRTYIVNHKTNDQWKINRTLKDVSDGFETIFTDNFGGFNETKVWDRLGKAPLFGNGFDLIVDVGFDWINFTGRPFRWNRMYDFDFEGRIDGKTRFFVIPPEYTYLILDNSLSMYMENYLEPVKSHVTNFVADLPPMNGLSAISFSSGITGANIVYPYTVIMDDNDRMAAINAINYIFPSNFETSFGGGLMPALMQIQQTNPEDPYNIIFVSDGYDLYPPYVGSVIGSVPYNTDIHTIALGNESDEDLMNLMAVLTLGMYFHSPDLYLFRSILNAIKEATTGEQVFCDETWEIPQGTATVNSTVTFNLDKEANHVTILLSNTTGNFTLSVTDPDGEAIDVLPSLWSSYDKIFLENPLPGEYTANITGTNTYSGGHYNLSVFGVSFVNTGFDINKKRFGIGEPAILQFSIEDLVLSEANIECTVQQADTSGEKQQVSFELMDDGMHWDGEPGDGIFGNAFTETDAPGSYNFTCKASGNLPDGGILSRSFLRSVYFTANPEIIVTRPGNGEVFIANSQEKVEWFHSNTAGTVNITLYPFGLDSYAVPLLSGTANDGSAEVEIPDIYSETCEIVVESVEYPGISGESNGVFSIGKPDIFISIDAIAAGAREGIETFDLTFTNNAMVEWSVETSAEWLEFIPAAGSGDATIEVHYERNESIDPRSSQITINAAQCVTPVSEISFTQEGIDLFTVNIPQGWSGISSVVQPFDADVEELMLPVLNQMIILQGLDGFYYPDGMINTLGLWDSHQGYVVKMIEPAMLTFEGVQLDYFSLSFDVGWNIMPVLSETPIPVEMIDDILGNHLVIIKEVAGYNVYYPDYGINSLSVLEPGKSYYVFVDEARAVNLPPHSNNSQNTNTYPVNGYFNPWNEVTKSPESHLVIFPKTLFHMFQSDYMIGAFDKGQNCAGIVWSSTLESDVSLGLNVFPDDPTTSIKEGFHPNEGIQFKLFCTKTGNEYVIQPSFADQSSDDLKFTHNGCAVVQSVLIHQVSLLESLDSVHHFIEIYPNPTQGIFTIEGSMDLINVRVFNAFGVGIFSGSLHLPAGIDLSSQPKGVYFIRMETETGSLFRKVVVN
ncbi:MAG: T9SS type A sorting domain-containing protein [Bacteroidales bacterium]|nr:T9SS type A sorting domain-containing protein [Bacteroidales bacterium]